MAERKRFKNLWMVPCFIMVAFLAYTGVRMATLDNTISMNLTYEVPRSSFSGVELNLNYGQWAVALNGKNVVKSAQELPQQPAASTAKMIMALAVMEKKPFNVGTAGENITITPELYNIYVNYSNAGGSTTAVQIGEEISEYDALASALIASSNNMADTLAIWAFGSLEEYQKYASSMLAELEIKHTTIGPDASGFNQQTTSTAVDLATIGELVLRQPILAEIVGSKSATVPVAGMIENTNKLLGSDGVIGVKTGYIGDASGYCLISGYKEGGDIVTLAVLGAPTRQASFSDTSELITKTKATIKTRELLTAEQEVGYYESWWTGKVPIVSAKVLKGIVISNAEVEIDGEASELKIATAETEYVAPLKVGDYPKEPTFWERFLHVFGWRKA